MSVKVGAISRPPAEMLHLPRLTMDWAFPMNGRPDGLGIHDEWAFRKIGHLDEWKSRRNFPPAGGKVAPPAINDGLGVPDEWAFPSNAMAFPSNGRSHLMGTPIQSERPIHR